MRYNNHKSISFSAAIFLVWMVAGCAARVAAPTSTETTETTGANSPLQPPKTVSEKTITLTIGTEIQLADGLVLTLESFSHKRPMVGGATKATANIKAAYRGETETLSLSQHGVEGKSPEEDGLPDEYRYDSMTWSDFKFSLIELIYNESITVTVQQI